MTLSEELTWRGFINQTTFDDLSRLDTEKWTFYHGFDASADSQTIGNLAAMMLDKAFMRHGHKAILLAGGATSLIGDPGGKDTERPLQDEATIAHNVDQARKQLEQLFRGQDFILVNNLDWTRSMTILEFLRDIGKHFGMSSLVQRDYIAARIGEGGSGISYTEFSYTLLQGMDFLHLYDEHGATLQLGGADQWGNCLSGVELIRKARGAEAHVITLPLIINKATGKKFGKSESGAVWLDPSKTSIYKFYQFWLNADDEGVEGYLKIFTELDKHTIDGIMADFQQNPQARSAQKRLAEEVTRLVHGQDRLNNVQKVTEALFDGSTIGELSDEQLQLLAAEIPVVSVGTSLIEALVASELAGSNGDARRLIESGGVSINGQKVQSDTELNEAPALIKKGKNGFALVR